MKSITLTTGRSVPLDGDLLSLLEAIYQEVALRKELQHSYDDVTKEIEGIIQQLSIEDLRVYFRESLSLNAVTYENEMLDAFLQRVQGARDES